MLSNPIVTDDLCRSFIQKKQELGKVSLCIVIQLTGYKVYKELSKMIVEKLETMCPFVLLT